MRKTSEVWNAIRDKKPANMGFLNWQQSYDGVCEALTYIGLSMKTTKEEFDALEIPTDINGKRNFPQRQIQIIKDDVVSNPITIHSILCGKASMNVVALTTENDANKVRSIQEIWKAIESLKPMEISQLNWQRTYAGLVAAFNFLGCGVVTTAEDFSKIPVPLDNNGRKAYSYRKIIISKNGIQSEPTIIKNLLSGRSAFNIKLNQQNENNETDEISSEIIHLTPLQPNVLRKISDIWNSIKRFKPDTMNQIDWHQSYEGTCAALEFVGLKMKCTKEEFLNITPPVEKSGKKKFADRKIVVYRNNIESKPTTIHHLLTGKSSLRTPEEMNAIHKKVSDYAKHRQPKSVLTTNNFEKDAIDLLNVMINVTSKLSFSHNSELRRSDISYKLPDENMYVGFQVKTAAVSRDRLMFAVTNGQIVNFLKSDLCVVCIGMTKDRKAINVVWVFFGDDIKKQFEERKESSSWNPTMQLKIQSEDPFVLRYNSSMYRFETGAEYDNHKNERKRLLDKIVEIVRIGKKQTLEYFNTDISQIKAKTHQTEQESFFQTRDAILKTYPYIQVEKLIDDNYSPIDFRVNNARIQDKVALQIHGFRSKSRYPYNPDEIDALQVSFLADHVIYLFFMRVQKNNEVVSYFSAKELMHQTKECGKNWKENNKCRRYDLNKPEDVNKYIEACAAAHAIPPLTDRSFYQNIIDANKDVFEKETVSRRSQMREARQRKRAKE